MELQHVEGVILWGPEILNSYYVTIKMDQSG